MKSKLIKKNFLRLLKNLSLLIYVKYSKICCNFMKCIFYNFNEKMNEMSFNAKSLKKVLKEVKF